MSAVRFVVFAQTRALRAADGVETEFDVGAEIAQLVHRVAVRFSHFVGREKQFVLF